MRHVFLAAGAALILFSASAPTAPSHPGRGILRQPAVQEASADIIGARFLDVDGNIRRLGDENGAGPAALVFVDDECPVSARYLGEMDAFLAEAEAAGIDFYAVMSSPRRSWADARKLRDDYALTTPVLFDASGDLAARLAPATLGEVFVINEDDRLIYRGRIDDRFESIGRLRRVIRSHDLLEAFEVADEPEAEARATTPIGCYFEAWENVGDREVTYARDIEPILAANCAECHQAGGVAPFALGHYRQASGRARMLAHVTGEGLMPPWRAVPRFGRFRDERYLSQTQIDLLAAWAAGGAAEGVPGDRAPAARLPDPGWRHGEPDLVLPMLEPYAVPASGDDVYRYFVIPSGLERPRTVTAIDFQPGDASVVHHANFFVDYSGRARREDAKDDEPGFSVFGTGSFMSYDNTDENAYGIGGWTPGAEPYSLPEGVGLWLPRGGDIVIEVHYKLNGRATTDQSKIAFYFADRPTPKYIDGLIIGTQDLDIPPGEAAYTRHISMDVPVGFRLVDVMPHMHYAGSRARMVVTYPDGREQAIVGIEDWDFRWQNIYTLRTPLHIPAGSRIDGWFEWDNSDANADNPFDPPRRLEWGWQSEEEMAEFWLGVIPDEPRRRMALIRASYRTWTNADSRPLPPGPRR
ncbi:MAG: redoxin domain-containing protein [Gemmatimonadota bacterium]|nr:redoxin domain-containing protein [Gemmatimonadota bacterium]